MFGYEFSKPELERLALTHPSFSGEMKKSRVESNQRLEFLGDAVLELVISDYLYKKYPDSEEGQLTKMRSSLVFEAALCLCANKIGLGEHLFLGKGEAQSGGREKPSVLSDAFEALIGAIYLDGGMEPAREFIYKNVLEHVDVMELLNDYKTKLQEHVQKNASVVRYETVELVDGDRGFFSRVYLDDTEYASGEGKTKKSAEQAAAKKALEKYVP
ncbi:MAG: ribonuclease III [Eubacteriales bacterium]|nr:ribonuclease III [Eubacteriales bacterium]